jgi:hypothetical protein
MERLSAAVLRPNIKSNASRGILLQNREHNINKLKREGPRELSRGPKACINSGIPYRIVGITNSAPSLIPDGHLLVTVFVLV